MKHKKGHSPLSENKRSENSYRISRRKFLKHSCAGIAGLTAPISLTACDDEEDQPPAGVGKVAVTKISDIHDMADIKENVRKAVEDAGGFGITPADRILIKPNIVHKNIFSSRVVTSPDVVKAVIQLLKEVVPAKNIWVGDAAIFTITDKTENVAKEWGLYQMCMDEGVSFLSFEEEPYTDWSHPSVQYLYQPAKIPRCIVDDTFTKIINMPMLKNHQDYVMFHAVFSLCMKNFVGLLKKEFRNGILPLSIIHNANLQKIIPEIGLCIPNEKLAMNIIDGTEAILRGGPLNTDEAGGMDVVKPNLIIASKDRVACDTVGLAALKACAEKYGYAASTSTDYIYMDRSVFEWDQIRRGAQLGLGRRDPDNIEIVSDIDEIDAIKRHWI